ncbi:MAG: AsmA family protein [Parvibaculum sp.]|uniref:AsmA family protein n=1 Tax=Parvibaculum sp. TaxID=2024848 RepID=UPI00284B4C57|nr:AsmA family protein [Parvibaculum sp.]MDR3498130.1 AsmA family protein [Parvibaculum sp.]
MNSVLSTIAGVVALLLIAALIGPTFIDWNRFRSEIEAQGQKVTGRPMKIGGDISFVILPAPHMTLNDVSIGNVPGAENSDFARIGQVDAEMALAPLVRGEISVTSVKVTRPQIHLEVAANGRNNWHDIIVAGKLPEDGLFGLGSVSLEQASFEEGTLTYSDRRTGRSWRVLHINGDVEATSLLGPMRAALDFEAQGAPMSLRLALGNFSGGKAFPITAELQAKATQSKLLFSGLATGFSTDARIDGTASLELGTVKTADGKKARPPLRIEAALVVGGETANFRSLVVAMAGTTLKGDATADWQVRPTASIHLKGEALTLDPLADRLRELAAGGKVPLGALTGLPLPGWIDINADVSIDGLLVHDILVKDAVLAVALKDGTLTVAKARGDIAGGTKVEMSGALSNNDGGPRFDGKVSAASGNLVALANWLTALRAEPGETAAPAETVKPKPAPAVLKAQARPFAISSKFSLTPDRLDFTNLAAAYAATSEPADLKGSLSFTAANKRPLISADMQARSFDLDPLAALWPANAPGPLALLNNYDVDLTATADRLTVGGTEVSGLDVSAAVTEGTLDLRRFNAASLAGAKVSFAGTLSDVTAGAVDALHGNVSGTLTAEKTPALKKLLGVDAPGVEGPVDLALSFVSGEADDSKARLDTLTVKGTIAASRVDAVLKRGHGPNGDAGRVDFVANATSNDGRALLKQLGLAPAESFAGAATASLQLGGPMGKPYDTVLRVNVGDGTFNAKGRTIDPLGAAAFTGHIDLTASGLASALAAVGASAQISDFALAQSGGPGFVMSADLKTDPASVSLVGLEAVAGNFHLSGDASYARAAEGKLPVLAGKLEANALDLTALFATAAGAQDTIWPTSALDWSALGFFDGDLDLKIGALTVGTAKLDQANMHLALASGVLSATPFAAQFAGGKAVLGLRIEGGKTGEPGIGLTFAADDVDLAKASALAFGASSMTGRGAINLQVQAQGRSWLGLASSASGTGSLKTQGAGFAPLDLAGFSAGLKSLKSLDGFAALQDKVLAAGSTSVNGLDGDFALKDGVAKINRDALDLKGGKGKLAGMFDLTRLAVDSELTVTLDEPKDAPSFSIVNAGRIGHIERRSDTLALQQFMSKQILKQSAVSAGLDFIPKQLKSLMGLTDDEKAKGPTVAGIPLPLARPEPHASLQ